MSPRNDPPSAEVLSITEVERQTGIRPATLRMWERRYGFPQPLRDRHGDRVYPLNQVERLHAARRLMAQGIRPGKIFAGNTVLDIAGAAPASVPSGTAAQFQPIFGLLRAYRLPELHSHFQHRLLELGLRRFVIDFLAPLTHAVGEAWGSGELPVRCEHLYSQLAMSILHDKQAAVRTAAGRQGQKALLATVTGETHLLGILMVEAVLATLGVECVQLGGDLPPSEVAAAAAETGAQIVALSFSAHFPRKNVMRMVRDLRLALPPAATLWIGGDGAADAGALPEGVQVFHSLDAIEPALLCWRALEAAR